MSTARKNKGRQKIEMKRMSNDSNLQVMFCKRRSGLFKKASELSTLCGADVALIVFSLADKVFSFGHPNVDTIIDRFLKRGPPHTLTETIQFNEVHRNVNIQELNLQLTQENNHLEVEKKRGDNLKRLNKATMDQFWWASPIEDLNKTQLDQLRMALEELKKSVTRNADKFLTQGGVIKYSTQFFSESSSNVVVHHHQHPLSAPTRLPPMVPQVFASHMLKPVILKPYDVDSQF